MDSGAGSDPDVYSYTYDGPQPYDYEPFVQHREQRETGGRINGQRREIELWCLENQWRVGQVSWPETGVSLYALATDMNAVLI